MRRRISLAAAAVVAVGIGPGAGEGMKTGERAGQGVAVLAWIDGRATIARLAAEGAPVKKGQVVAILDSAELQAQLDAQTEAEALALAELADARDERAEAELALTEAVEGEFPLELAAVDGEIALARAGQAVAAGRIGRAWVPTPLEEDIRQQSELDLLRADVALTQAEGRRELLVKYTQPRRTRELEREIRRARAVEAARRAAVEMAHARVDRLRKQVALCTLTAPADGRVTLARPDDDRAPVAPGSTVAHRQVVLRIIPAAELAQAP